MFLTAFLDELSIGYLVAFALAMRTIAQKLPQTQHAFLAPVLGAVTLSIYFVEHAAIQADDFEQLTVFFVRTLSVFQITAGLVTVLLAIGFWLPQRSKTVSPRRRRRLAKLANREFESERRLLARMPLDEDEREILLMQAKQRLLQKLSQLPGDNDASERQ